MWCPLELTFFPPFFGHIIWIIQNELNIQMGTKSEIERCDSMFFYANNQRRLTYSGPSAYAQAHRPLAEGQCHSVLTIRQRIASGCAQFSMMTFDTASRRSFEPDSSIRIIVEGQPPIVKWMWMVLELLSCWPLPQSIPFDVCLMHAQSAIRVSIYLSIYSKCPPKNSPYLPLPLSTAARVSIRRATTRITS